MERILFFISLLLFFNVSAQTQLKADGQSDTYRLINDVLAPGADVVETPDCIHTDFGDHITQEWDEELKKFVFVFHAHTYKDNDRCKKEDRQRTEIKTYKKSPDELKGTKGETVLYKWKFKLHKNFRPSKRFTHLHQIKAVGGSEDAMPSITLTARKSSPDQFQLLYSKNLFQEEIVRVDLAELKGQWIQAEEQITYGEAGNANYYIKLTQIKTGKVILEYSSKNLRMWKTGAEIMRPKWGIYRSILSPSDLRDEQVKFADFYVMELP